MQEETELQLNESTPNETEGTTLVSDDDKKKKRKRNKNRAKDQRPKRDRAKRKNKRKLKKLSRHNKKLIVFAGHVQRLVSCSPSTRDSLKDDRAIEAIEEFFNQGRTAAECAQYITSVLSNEV